MRSRDAHKVYTLKGLHFSLKIFLLSNILLGFYIPSILCISFYEVLFLSYKLYYESYIEHISNLSILKLNGFSDDKLLYPASESTFKELLLMLIGLFKFDTKSCRSLF